MSQGPSFKELVKRAKRTSVPTIPTHKTINGSNTPENHDIPSPNDHKPKHHARYETYILCPDCGSMVPKGTKFCDCGHDFRNPFWKSAKKILRYAVPALLCVCCAVGGYYYGRESMAPELDAQYELGHEAGYDSGYSIGIKEGRTAGVKIASENYPKIFEDAYRTALYDNSVGTYGIRNFITNRYRFDFTARDVVHKILAEEYGFKSVSTNPFLAMAPLN